MSKLRATKPSIDPARKCDENFSTSTPYRTVEQTNASSDLWYGDMASTLFEPTSE